MIGIDQGAYNYWLVHSKGKTKMVPAPISTDPKGYHRLISFIFTLPLLYSCISIDFGPNREVTIGVADEPDTKKATIGEEATARHLRAIKHFQRPEVRCQMESEIEELEKGMKHDLDFCKEYREPPKGDEALKKAKETNQIMEKLLKNDEKAVTSPSSKETPTIP